jgi:DNA repair protein RecO (recombination protein O)
MLTKINGLIIRDIAYGESDKLFTVLTAESGKITVSGKGVRSPKSVLRPYSHIMFYGELTLYERNGRLWLREASAVRDFYDVSLGLEGLSLVAYIFDVINDICVEGEDESASLSLTLNTLHMIAAKQRSLRFIKAVFEMRCAVGAGYTPMLDGGCGVCGRTDARSLDCAGGCLICDSCAAKPEHKSIAVGLHPDVIRAIRYITAAAPSRVFAFRLTEEAEENFFDVCENYLTAQIDRTFSTLEYFNALYG